VAGAIRRHDGFENAHSDPFIVLIPVPQKMATDSGCAVMASWPGAPADRPRFRGRPHSERTSSVVVGLWLIDQVRQL